MAVAIAREVVDGTNVGVGVNSPVPALGVLLARATHAPNARLRMPGSESGEPFLGSKEFFDMAQRGRIDVFFFSGVQIDRRGRINLHVLGDYDRPRRRFAGAFGSAVLYELIPRVILFRSEHTPRSLVERVDFVSAAGTPQALVTPRAVLRFDRVAGEFQLESWSPGETAETVRAATGWDLSVRPGAALTPAPSPDELALLRGRVLDQLGQVYPRYAAAARA